jgi:phosphate transport system substrate-binding protein
MKHKCFLFILVTLMVASCGPSKKTPTKEDYEVRVAVDETFRPIMEEEAKVFNASFPDAIMDISYLPETDAINMLLKDSVRMILATRELSKKECDAILQVNKLVVRQQPIAYDAIALIINPSNKDSLISVSQIEKIMTGKITRWSQLGGKSNQPIEVVFDNSNSSSVRFVRDSVCAGAPLKGNIKEAKTNQKVIDYVAQTPNAIGIIGVDWLRNSADSTNLTFDKRIRVMSVSYSAVPEQGNSFQPVQYYIATGDYPLTRSVYMITTDPRSRSMNLNFYYFIGDQRGQLIITKSSQLLPYMPVQVKTVDVSN